MGCVLYELLTCGERLFAGVGKKEVRLRFINRDLRTKNQRRLVYVLFAASLFDVSSTLFEKVCLGVRISVNVS